MTSEELLKLGKETDEMDFAKTNIMTDNEIIKVLENCANNRSCAGCSFRETKCTIEADALDLIKRQQAEIEKLEYDNVHWNDWEVKCRAIEEFWTKVRAYAVVMGCYHIVEYGDGTVKEMVGE